MLDELSFNQFVKSANWRTLRTLHLIHSNEKMEERTPPTSSNECLHYTRNNVNFVELAEFHDLGTFHSARPET